MEKPLGLWLRTEGIAGSVVPTIEPAEAGAALMSLSEGSACAVSEPNAQQATKLLLSQKTTKNQQNLHFYTQKFAQFRKKYYLCSRKRKQAPQ